ncbi:hypothetical protein ACT3CD_02250 [Geofilum sp. OHC36d9]
MTHFAAIFWYLFLVAVIVGSYYASAYAIKRFDKKWKETTLAEENELTES